eukprot:ANDGO_07357.mRNA.1 Polycystin-2
MSDMKEPQVASPSPTGAAPPLDLSRVSLADAVRSNPSRPGSARDGTSALTARRHVRIDDVLESPHFEQPKSRFDYDILEKTKEFFRETAVYLLFLILFCTIIIGVRSGQSSYLLSNNIRDHLLNEEFPKANVLKTFFDVGEIAEFWEYYRTVFVNQMYADNWYNGDAFSGENEQFLFLYQNMIIGGIEMRQVRVAPQRCDVSNRIRSIVPTCYPEFSDEYQQKSNLQPTNSVFTSSSPYLQWRSAADTGDIAFWARVSTYPASGYVAIFPNNNSTYTQQTLDTLYSGLWLDRSTRAVMTSMTFYNPNLNLFTQMKMVNEFPASGGAVNSASTRTILLFPYVSTTDYIILALEILFVMMIVYYMVEELIEIFSEGPSYFTKFWNYFDWINLIFFGVTIALRITVYAKMADQTVVAGSSSYVSYEYVAYLSTQESNVNAINGFIMFFKLFKYLSIFPRMAVLSETISNAAIDLLSFFFMFFIIFLGFSIAFFISMGRDLFNYSTVPRSMQTLFQAAVGAFDYDEIAQANRILGPILFVMYMLLVFYILANMFIAIISNSYEEMSTKIKEEEQESLGVQIFDFLKLNLKKRLAADEEDLEELHKIGSALDMKKADIDNDQRISRKELIDLVGDEVAQIILNYYDVDDNGSLDLKEVQRIQEDVRRREEELIADQAASAAALSRTGSRMGVLGDRPMSARGGGGSTTSQALAIATIISGLNNLNVRLESISSRMDRTDRNLKALSGTIAEKLSVAAVASRSTEKRKSTG